MSNDLDIELARVNAQIRTREAELLRAEKAVPAQPTKAELAERAAKQECQAVCARADAIFKEYGRAAPLPIADESALAYRIRVIDELKVNTRFADKQLSRTTDRASLDVIEGQAYADAWANRQSPLDVPAGVLREIVKTDETGRRISEFVSGRGSKGMFKQVFGMFIAPPLFQEGGFFVNGVEKFPRVMPT
ncbi:hypothetical protein SBC1_31450 [Caballeronia sp. SBC1]|uniref:hypothetical protein n=1 Tax=Caballeronia sp. SBC1 TaxID=2705548 RepID=UPI0014098C95|nr:hypothetical protein [Caballeronia sp. SBC1]QIN63121.1 hypothetical protein SBC1_31450 [Caballeronia sp. SBC1]